MSRLLALPTELRLMIWKYAVPQDEELRFDDTWHDEDENDAVGWIDFRLNRYMYSNENDRKRDEERVWVEWIGTTLSLFLLDRRTSAEVQEVFFGGNTFAFTVDCEGGLGLENDQSLLHARWTFPDTFEETVRRICIIQIDYFRDELAVRSMQNLLELLAHRLAGPRLVSAGLTARRPLEHLDISDASWRLHTHDYHHIPYMLEPLLALNTRKVSRFTIGMSRHYPGTAMETSMEKCIKLTRFERKLGRALLEGLQPPARTNTLDEADEEFSPKHDWSAIEELSQEDVTSSPGAKK